MAEPTELDYDKVYANTKRILEIKVTKEAGVVTAKARYTLWAYNYQNPDNPYETMSLCPCGGENLGKTGNRGAFVHMSARIRHFTVRKREII